MPRPRDGERWNREEHLLAFNLYCQIPFGVISQRNPRVIELSRLLGRTPASVSLKLGNFARLDPALQARGISGMSHGAKGEEEIWEEFTNQPEALAFESEQLLATRLGRNLEEVAEVTTTDLPPAGLEREAIIRIRVNQSFFRRRILSAYEYRCCVTGLTFQPLLVASHIVPWSQDPKNRLNPRNGLCLNAFHDRTFDRGHMWLSEEHTVSFSKALRERTDDASRWLTSYHGKPVQFPARLTPHPNFLQQHANSPLVLSNR